MPQTLHRLFKWLGFLALGCYVFVALAVIGIRYGVAPNIEQWREPLQRELSTMLSAQVELGEVTADWTGPNPRIHLRDTRLRDEAGRQLLDIPALDAVVAWSSLFSGELRFVSLRADGVALSVRRDRNERVRMLGYELDETDPVSAGDEPFSDLDMFRWFVRQGKVQFMNAQVRWIDEFRQAPPLQLTDVSLALGSENGGLTFSMRARPPQTLGESFSFQGRLDVAPSTNGALALDRVSGLFHVDVQAMQPANWRPWIDVYSAIEGGRIAWRGWQEMVNGELGRHVSQLRVSNGEWRPFQAESDASVSAESAELYVSGAWAALRELQSGPAVRDSAAGTSRPVRMALRMKGLSVELSDLLEAPLAFDDIALVAELGLGAATGLNVNVERAQLRNSDMDLDLDGTWQERGGGDAGIVDMKGRFERAELAAIVKYLPTFVDANARAWMRHGLLAGQLSNAPVRLQGDLDYFPFGERPDKGDFDLGGAVAGVVIDYAPASAVGPPGWPRLEDLKGSARLHRVDLTIQADSMSMRPGGLPIHLNDVHARIPNVEEDAVLDVGGNSQAHAAAYISLIRHSPLAEFLDGVFDTARAEGLWDVPIQLTVPLGDVDNTRVSGSVKLHDASLQISSAFPDLRNMSGQIHFDEKSVTTEGLKAHALGGPVVVSGGVGKAQKELTFEGRLSAKALAPLLGAQSAEFFSGTTAYSLGLHRTAEGAYGVRFDAPLEGFSIHLPEPLTKPERARWPLRVQWAPATSKSDAILTIGLADSMDARLLHGSRREGETFFHAGVVNVNGKASARDSGLAADIQLPRIDIDAWRSIRDRIDSDKGSNESVARARLLPPLRDLRLQSEHATVFGMDLDRLTFTARRPEGQRWRVDVSSTQSAGTLFWQEREGRIQGEVEATFERLALGKPADATVGRAEQDAHEEEATPNFDQDINIPAVRLAVDRLRLYGRDLGALSVVGVNQADGRIWNLEQLELSSPHGSLKGSGLWRLAGAERGLRLQAKADFQNLGAYLEQAGFTDLMEGGQGMVHGSVEWRDLPWKFDRSQLYGDLQIDLTKGRFLSLGSRSARLLELLSLQSVKRLASREWNPAGLIKQGFPFDTLQGNVRMDAGTLHSENYRVAGPVGTIVIAGDVDLPKETLDLYAVVVPNLDVSGAAIAAGIAVNPIVGLGAFLTQWLLKDPLSKAMAVEYRIKGEFDSPKIEEISTRVQNEKQKTRKEAH